MSDTTSRHDPGPGVEGELARVDVGGPPYHLAQTRCATCERVVLWLYRVGQRGEGLYDRVVFSPGRGPRGVAHVCLPREGADTPGPARQEGLFDSHGAAGSRGPYGRGE